MNPPDLNQFRPVHISGFDHENALVGIDFVLWEIRKQLGTHEYHVSMPGSIQLHLLTQVTYSADECRFGIVAHHDRNLGHVRTTQQLQELSLWQARLAAHKLAEVAAGRTVGHTEPPSDLPFLDAELVRQETARTQAKLDLRREQGLPDAMSEAEIEAVAAEHYHSLLGTEVDDWFAGDGGRLYVRKWALSPIQSAGY